VFSPYNDILTSIYSYEPYYHYYCRHVNAPPRNTFRFTYYVRVEIVIRIFRRVFVVLVSSVSPRISTIRLSYTSGLTRSSPTPGRCRTQLRADRKTYGIRGDGGPFPRFDVRLSRAPSRTLVRLFSIITTGVRNDAGPTIATIVK